MRGVPTLVASCDCFLFAALPIIGPNLRQTDFSRQRLDSYLKALAVAGVDLEFVRDNHTPRLPSAAMILSGSAVQVKGLGSRLASVMQRLMAAWRSTTDRKTSRLTRRFDSFAKKPSTALSREQDVGTKWKVKHS